MTVKVDEETGGEGKVPLLLQTTQEEEPPAVKEEVRIVDRKDAVFWLTMLFIASVTMTVGNKVSTVK